MHVLFCNSRGVVTQWDMRNLLLGISLTSYSSLSPVNINFIEFSLRHGCSPVNLLHIFRTPFPKNTSGRLLLSMVIRSNVLVKRGKNIPKSRKKKTWQEHAEFILNWWYSRQTGTKFLIWLMSRFRILKYSKQNNFLNKETKQPRICKHSRLKPY